MRDWRVTKNQTPVNLTPASFVDINYSSFPLAQISTLKRHLYTMTSGKPVDHLFTVHTHRENCQHDDLDHQHPDIISFTFTFTFTTKSTPGPPENSSAGTPSIPEDIGFITAHLISNSNSMYTQAHAFDTAHAPEAKLHKVENYLSNECFYQEKQALLDRAEWVLYLEKAYLEPEYRGRGWGLKGVDEVVRRVEAEIAKKEKGGQGEMVVLLEPGPIVLGNEGRGWEGDRGAEARGFDVCGGGKVDGGEKAGVASGLDVEDATEKIARHWKRMGFEAWSYTDEAWLCLWAGHWPAIEEVVRSMKQQA